MLSINIEEEMRQSYLDYSMSGIIGRALSDVRDGLKPVHRRILCGMRECVSSSTESTEMSPEEQATLDSLDQPAEEQKTASSASESTSKPTKRDADQVFAWVEHFLEGHDTLDNPSESCKCMNAARVELARKAIDVVTSI